MIHNMVLDDCHLFTLQYKSLGSVSIDIFIHFYVLNKGILFFSNNAFDEK